MILNSVLDFNYIYKMGSVLLQRYNNSIVWPLLKLHLLICGILVNEQTSMFNFRCLRNATFHTKRCMSQNELMLPTFVYTFVSCLFTFLEFARTQIHIKCPSCCHNAAIEETHSSPVHQLDNLYTMEGVKSSIILFKQITRRLLNKR